MSMQEMKVIGRRRSRGGLLMAAPFLELIVSLRGKKPFIPKGVHRFASFEESQRWSIKMMARPQNLDPRR
jgi:hypothetical protein